MTNEKRGATPCETTPPSTCSDSTRETSRETRWGAYPEDWQCFVGLGLTADLLPVVSDPTVPISPHSKMSNIGKTPSRINGMGHASGFKDWTQHRTTASEVDRWTRDDRLGICLQTRTVRAIDVDVPNAEEAQKIADRISLELSQSLPRRHRSNSAKFLLAFKLPGDYAKRSFKTKHGLVEFLATGQQFISAGTHPGGARYEWAGGLPADIPSLTPEQFEALWAVLVAEFAIGESTEHRQGATPDRPRTADDTNDSLVAFLVANDWVLSTDRSGRVDIECPFQDGHSTASSESSTSYFPAGVGGIERGMFKCLHTSCAHRTQADFADAVGWSKEGFEVIEILDPEPPRMSRFNLLSRADLKALKPLQWLVKGVLPAEGVAAIYGPPGSGKSFLTLDLCCAIAEGGWWFGYRVKTAPVVYLALEGQAGFRLRVDAWEHKTGRPLPADFQMVFDPFDLNSTEDVKELAPLLPRGCVVVVDTLAKATPGADENSGADMGRVLKAVAWLARRVGGLVLLVAHTGKDASKGLRGWSGVVGALDASIETSGERESLVKAWTNDKQKDARSGAAHPFTLQVVELGVDDDLDPLTSCVVVEGGTPAAKARKVPKGAAMGLDTLREVCEGLGKPSAHVDVWREAFYARSTADTPAAKRQAFTRARADLVELGLVVVESDLYEPLEV